MDPFAAELREAREAKEYATFWEAVVYLHSLYAIALQTSGSLTTGPKAELIKQLRELNLAPYGDIISRLSQATLAILRQTKKIEFRQIFSIERFPSEDQKKVDLRGFRSMCLKIKPLVLDEFRKHKPIVVVDKLDVPFYLAQESAHLVGVLIRWLTEMERETDGAVRFIVALPAPLFEVMKREGEHQPAQDVFHRLTWSEEESTTLIAERLRVALENFDSDEMRWLKDVTGFELAQAHRLAFARPRNYVKLVRHCLLERKADPDADAETIWKRATVEYAGDVLDWLGVEWAAEGLDGFRELCDLLRDHSAGISMQQLKKDIQDIRKNKLLRQHGVQSIVRRLTEWGLLVSQPNRQDHFNVHPVMRMAK